MFSLTIKRLHSVFWLLHNFSRTLTTKNYKMELDRKIMNTFWTNQILEFDCPNSSQLPEATDIRLLIDWNIHLFNAWVRAPWATWFLRKIHVLIIFNIKQGSFVYYQLLFYLVSIIIVLFVINNIVIIVIVIVMIIIL